MEAKHTAEMVIILLNDKKAQRSGWDLNVQYNLILILKPESLIYKILYNLYTNSSSVLFPVTLIVVGIC